MPRYIYQRNGRPILSWQRAAPSGTRAAETRSLGGYESFPGGQLVQIAGAKVGQASGLGCGGCSMQGLGSLGEPTLEMPLPRAGAPEPLPSIGALPEASPLNLAIGAGVAYALYKIFKKRR